MWISFLGESLNYWLIEINSTKTCGFYCIIEEKSFKIHQLQDKKKEKRRQINKDPKDASGLRWLSSWEDELESAPNESTVW